MTAERRGQRVFAAILGFVFYYAGSVVRYALIGGLWYAVLNQIIGHTRPGGEVLGLLIVAGLVTLVIWAWDR